MTREQAINYLFSCGFTNEQVGEVVRALTYEPTTMKVENLCDLCGNAIICPMQAGIIREECGLYKPTTKNNLGVDEVTALAEWTEKLTEANKSAYSQGYADGMKAQKPRKGYWLRRPHVYGVTYCSECDFELRIDNTNYCPNCGAKMESEET